MALGFVGTLISGAVADRLATRGISVLWVSLVFVLVFLVIEALLMAGVTRSPPVLAFAFGMFGQSAILLYPWLSPAISAVPTPPVAAMRRSISCPSVAFATQYGFGAVLDLWPSIKAGATIRKAIAPPSPSASPRRRWRSCGFSPALRRRMPARESASASVPIAEVIRGGFVESRHEGAFAIIGPGGGMVRAGGDIERPIYPRSAIKAMQCLAVIESGAAERSGF